MRVLHRNLVWCVVCVWCAVVHADPVQVTSLNPIVSDLARQIGGNNVEVIDLMPLGADPHGFYPSPDDLKHAAESKLILAAGKKLEPYLEEMRTSLGGRVPVFEVGDSVPSLRMAVDEVSICCPSHARDTIDPHWWHSVKNARRAAAAIAKRFSEIDPERAEIYEQRYQTYAGTLAELYRWAKKQIGTIPRRDRELTTSHAAFGYLCRELGLRSITVQGLSTEQNPAPAYLKDVIEALRRHRVRAVFPEDNANPKVMASMVRETNVAVGGQLYAGTLSKEVPTYEAMMRHNITTIVDSLAGEQ